MSEDRQRIVERGNQANALKHNPLLAECVEKLKEKYIDEWRKTAPGDIEGRERLYTAYGLVDQIFTHLNILIGDGQIAAQQIEKLKRRA